MSTSGMYLTTKIGATPVELEDNNVWKVSENAKELDRTTGSDGGFGNVDAGVQRATITIHGWVDLAVNGGPYESIRAGTILTNLMLFYNRGDEVDAAAYTFPLAVVVDSDCGGEVDGQFEFNATVKNKGSYSYVGPAGD